MLGEKASRIYQWYVADYKRYLQVRGYGDHLNDWMFVKRGFLECWLEPGFHRFWQAWNPGIGYFAYKLYLLFGGNARRDLATIAAFVINGLIHNLVVSLIVDRWDFPLPFTFLSFGILTVVFRRLDGKARLDRFPKALHLATNVGLVIVSSILALPQTIFSDETQGSSLPCQCLMQPANFQPPPSRPDKTATRLPPPSCSAEQWDADRPWTDLSPGGSRSGRWHHPVGRRR